MHVRIDRDTARGFLGVLLALAIIGAIHQVRPHVGGSADFPCAVHSTGQTTIDIHSGEVGSDIAQELFDKGVTASYGSFYSLAVADLRAQRIAPGLHTVDLGICAKRALDQLLDSKRISNLLVVNEGAWISEIKQSLLRIGFNKSEISQGFSKALIPHGFTTIEGLLFPAQYSFDSSTSISEILSTMIFRGSKEMQSAGLFSSAEKFTPAQLLTIASLVQAEGDEKDFSKISQVVRNRISKGMPLQFDSTVHYVKGSRGSVFLSTQSTYLNSPYNTYRRYGLPPGPINNPGKSALEAAVHPAKGDWIFFITVAPGDTRFTSKIEEFNSWKILYKKNLRAGKFGRH